MNTQKRHTDTHTDLRVQLNPLTTKCFTPLTCAHTHTHTHTHTLWVSRLLNTLPTWQPGALLVKSFPIGCTRIRFHFKEPAGSRAARHRRENITLLFRESRREWGDDRQKRWMDIEGGSESAGKGGSVVISLSNITPLQSLSCSPQVTRSVLLFSPHLTPDVHCFCSNTSNLFNSAQLTF